MAEASKKLLIACEGSALIPLDDLVEFQGRLKDLPPENYAKLKKELLELGFSSPIHVWKHEDGKSRILDGHQRVRALRTMRQEDGLEVPPLPIVWVQAKDENEARKKVLALTSAYGVISAEGLREFLEDADISPKDLGESFRFPDLDMEDFILNLMRDGEDGEKKDGPEARPNLADRFMVPPFSILDARRGYWKERRERWMKLGIKSEEGRAGNLLRLSETLRQPDPEKRKIASANKDYEGGNVWAISGTSIFDPVLCELGYRWFCPKGGAVLDPFAGGSVRGIVASMCGFPYTGVELRAEQIKSNEEQAAALKCEGIRWLEGDSAKVVPGLKEEFDFIFSCPPYFNLEKYSESESDLSNMTWENFLKSYRAIIAACAEKLKPNRFAAFVVSEVRAKGDSGAFLGFPLETIRAFRDAGLEFYNEASYVQPVGTLALRAGKAFVTSRKLGRTHQVLLVFVKGDPRKAAQDCGVVEVEMPENEETQEESEGLGGSY